MVSGALALSRKEKAEFYSNRGFDHYLKGDLNIAIADFDEAIRLYPKDAYAYYARADAYKRIGDYDKADADAKEGLRLDPTRGGSQST